MIKLTEVNKLYLGENLLKDISWQMSPGEKIGLIGRNGTGKTTQLRIICGFEEADGGEVYVAPEIKIGYLSQEPLVDPKNTLDAEMHLPFNDVLEAEKHIKDMEKEISTLNTGYELEDGLKKLAKSQEYFDLKEGYTIETRIGQVLAGLGFKEQDRSRLIGTFSGGWQMRISIAKLLLESPDLLLLDEPTNHLDIKAIEWLENYLSSYKGGYIIISHDRQFLDRTVSRIIEMDGAKVNLYWGNYSRYLELKEANYQNWVSAYNAQQEKIAKEKVYIDRFRASAARASQVKSREKQLEKLELIKPPPRPKRIKFCFPVTIKSGEEILKITHLDKAYDDNKVLEDINLEILSGEKIALIGDNGTGKTTLLRIIMGIDKEYSGKVKSGYLVKPMYFNQHQARSLSGPITAMEELHNSAPTCTNEQVRAILGRFGITGDNVFKTLNDLSGGEKARLALSKMLLGGANFLLFDEPTNHLDIPAKEALEEALKDYEGTVIVVSHDRTFIDNIATKIIEIENKKITIYHGNYSYYKFKKNKELQQTVQEQPVEKQENKNTGLQKKEQESEKNKKLSPKAIEKQSIKLEKEIVNLEDKIAEAENRLADPEFYQNSPEEYLSLSQELESMKIKLNELNEEWYGLLEMQ